MVYFTILYVAITIIVGLLAARLVKNTEDYLLAGICIILPYPAWIAAQMVAFGIIYSSLSGIGMVSGILPGCFLVTSAPCRSAT